MRYLENYRNLDLINGSVADEALLTAAGREISRLPQPFMAHILTSATHHPYMIPEQLRTLHLGSLDGTMLGDYLQAVHYLDTSIGELLDELQASGILDRTVLALLGDHHPYPDDPLAVAEALGRPATDYTLWDLDKRLPLLVRFPRGQYAQTIGMPSGHIDLLPTLLGILGVPIDTEVTLGRDATAGNSQAAFVVFRDGSFVAGRSAFVAPSRFDEAPRCFNLETGDVTGCAPLEGLRPRAEERLRMSDLIIGADLIPDIRLTLKSHSASSHEGH